jgi:hypothetical protein
MHNKFGKDLVILSVNLDDPLMGDFRDRAAKVLAIEKAPFITLGGASKDEINAIVDEWKVQLLPRNVFYDREGKVAQEIEGGDPEELNKAAQKLLKKD